MPRWTIYASIIGLSLAVHLKGVSSPVLDYHWHRQANTASIARDFHRYHLPPWAPRIDWEGGSPERAATELPLYMWLVGLLWPLFGLGVTWGRLVSIACSAGGAVALFAFLESKDGSGWMETGPAWLAALFFSLLPIEIYFGRTVQPEALALLCTVVSFWALDRYEASSGSAAAGWWALCAAAAVLAIGHKLPYVYILGVLGCLALARRGRSAALDLRLWALVGLVTGLVFSWYRFAAAGGAYVVPTTRDPGVIRSILSYDRLPYFMAFQVFSRLPELALTYPGLLFFAIGVRELVWRRRAYFLGAWWLCVLLDLWAGGGYVHYHEYTALPWAPVNAAFIGFGVWTLWRAASSARARAGVLALCLGVPIHAALRIAHWYRLSFPELLTLKPEVDRVSAAGDLFLCNERASSLILYFIDRKGWSWNVAEAGPAGLPRVEEVAAKGARYFLTRKEGIFLDPKDPVARWFLDRYPVVSDDGRVLILRLKKT